MDDFETEALGKARRHVAPQRRHLARHCEHPAMVSSQIVRSHPIRARDPRARRS